MNNVLLKGSSQFQKYWYLGFLGFVGIFEMPELWAYLQDGIGSAWSLTNPLWLLWFSYFLPENKTK